MIGTALVTVTGVDDDYDEMMKRLDNKSGRPEMLRDVIMSQLKRLKPMAEGEPKKFIGLVETVESCWLDMRRLHMEGEMRSITIISQIEMPILLVTSCEWAITKQKFKLVTNVDQFQSFLKFLIQEKEAMEYIQGGGGVGGGGGMNENFLHIKSIV